MNNQHDDKYFINPAETSYQGICPHCSSRLYNVLPLEPVFSAKDSHNFIPMPYSTFKNWLSQHADLMSKPTLYRRDNNRRMHRYLRASDLKIVRDYTFSTRLESGKYSRIFTLYEQLNNGPAKNAEIEPAG